MGCALLLASGVARAQTTEIAVQGIRPRRDTTELRLTAEHARAQPGTHDDPAKVIENLPGVSRSGFGSGQLLLWGAAPQDSRVYVDGVEIPQLFHGSGIRSTVSGNLLQSLSLSPGAYGADYGRAVGGMVRLETRELPSDRLHGVLEASTLDGSLLVSGPVAPRLRVALGGRYGLLDRTLRLVNARDIGEFYAVPRYYDYQAKAQLELRAGESLDLVLLGSGDSLDHSLRDADPTLARTSQSEQSFQRLYARYRRRFDDGASLELVPWIGRDVSRYRARFGEAPAELEQRAGRYGFRAEHRSRLGEHGVLRLGLDAAGTRSAVERHGSLTIPAREGDPFVLGQLPSDDNTVDQWQATVLDLAPYAALDWQVGPLSMVSGVRAAGYLLETSRRTPRVGQTPAIGHSAFEPRLEPRVGLRLRLSRRVALSAAAGLYSQPPAAQDLSAVFGSPTLGPERAAHLSFGESVELASVLSLTMTSFYRSLSRLTARDPSPTPELARALLQEGEGRSYGVQTLFALRPWHDFSGSLSATLSRSERRETPSSRVRPFDYDQPLVLSAVASRALGPWSVGLRFRYASGSPRTPVVGVFFVDGGALAQPILGERGSTRLPAFWQLDLRIDRELRIARTARLVAYLELLNVTNHRNGEEFEYSRDYTQRGLVTGMPFVGVIGARLEL